MAIEPKCVSILRDALDNEHTIEEAIAAQRAAGCTQIETVKALREVLDIGLGEAKQIVDESPTWSDRRQLNEHLRREAFRGVLDQC